MKQNIGELISNIIDNRLMSLDICLPATIDNFNEDDLTADVIPDLERKLVDGSVITSKTIFDLPILYPMTSSRGLIFPLKKGDKCVLIVAQRSLEQWRSNGPKAPSEASLFPRGSALVLPGVSHKNMVDKLKNPKDGMGLIGDKIFIGDLAEKPSTDSTLSSVDLIEAFTKAMDQILQATYPTAVGPTGTMVNPAVLQAIKTEIEKLQT